MSGVVKKDADDLILATDKYIKILERSLIIFVIIFIILFIILIRFFDVGCTIAHVKNNTSDKSIACVTAPEVLSPADHITDSNTRVYSHGFEVDVPDRELFYAGYTNTNSMDPLLDDQTAGIEIIPINESDIYVGDIISYEYGGDLIVHQVIYIGNDGEGLFYIAKGINNEEPDPIRIRFDMIRGVLIAVIY